MKKAIIFDVGGVIATENRELFDLSVSEIKPYIDFDLFTKTKKKPENYYYWEEYSTGQISTGEFWTAMLKGMYVNPTEENVGIISNGYQKATWNNVDHQLLRYIKEVKENNPKYKVVVLSNSSTGEERCAEKGGWLDVFDEVFFSHKIGYRKPDPKAFLYVAQQINVDAEDCMFIDDKVSNTKFAAQELGMKTHTYKRDFSELKERIEQFLV